MSEEKISMSEAHTRESIEDFFRQAVYMLETNKEMIRSVMIESLQETGENQSVFEYLEPFFDGLLAKLYNNGITVEDPSEVLTTEFFFSAAPLLMFAGVGDKWADYNGFDKEEVRKYFIDSFNKIYVEYFYNRFFKK